MAQRLLDRFDGVTRERPVAADEASWLHTNGLGFMQAVQDIPSGNKSGKAALIEAFSMTAPMKDAVRSGHLNSSDIYRFACDQPQYETLASAGVRAVQGLGCRLRDCMTQLESTSDAVNTPGLRARLARQHRLSLVQVADAIDMACEAEDRGEALSIEAAIERVMEATCALGTL